MRTYTEGKPVNIGGLKIIPTFNWPEWYVKEIRAEYRQANKPQTPEQIAESYARWLAAKNGIALDGTNHIEPVFRAVNGNYKDQRVAAVVFWKRDPRLNDHSFPNRNYDEPIKIAEILIPHWDHTPSFSEDHYAP